MQTQKTSSEIVKNVDITTIRSFLIHNSSKILESLTTFKQKGNLLDNQDDLFGDAPQEEKKIDWDYNFKSLKELDILIEEKNSLGLYVSGNPLAKFEALEGYVKEILDKDDIFLVLIDKSKKIMTRTNILMYALQITTTGEESKYEAIIFPKKVMEVVGKIQEKEIFWLRGKVLDKNKKKAQKENEDEENSYDEIPKIAVDDLCLVTENPASLYQNEEVQIPINRKNMLDAINWENIKENPTSFLQPEFENKPNVVETTHRRVEEKPEIKQVKIFAGTSAEIMKVVKSMLKPKPFDGSDAIELFVQVRGEWKKSRAKFWGDYEKIQEILNN